MEILRLRREGGRGRLDILFPEITGVADGSIAHSGGVQRAGTGVLNLHEPGVVRLYLEAALTASWDPADHTVQHLNGWAMFDQVLSRRKERCLRPCPSPSSSTPSVR